MDDNLRRAMKLCDMMDEKIRSQSPAERDRQIQQFLAQAQTPAESFRTLVAMMDFVIANSAALKEVRDG